MRAILSVSDKAGLVDFAKGLTKLDIEIFSTGGTKDALKKAGVPVQTSAGTRGRSAGTGFAPSCAHLER